MAGIEARKRILWAQVEFVVMVEPGRQTLTVIIRVIVAEGVERLQLDALMFVIAAECEPVVARAGIRGTNGDVAPRWNRPRPRRPFDRPPLYLPPRPSTRSPSHA